MEIIRFNPVTESDLAEMSKLYAEVFAGPPWNEYTKCPSSQAFFGQETEPGQRCPEDGCTETLEEAYPLSTTIDYIAGEANQPKSITLGLRNGKGLVGFAWGFTYPKPEAFTRKKYRSERMKETIAKVFTGNGVAAEFFYISECGIGQPFRGQGLSNELFQTLLEEAKRLSLPTVMRTNAESPMVAVAERFGMRQVLGPKVEADRINRQFIIDQSGSDRVIDLENKSRVIFVLGQ